MRTLQSGWVTATSRHRNLATTEIYADYAPDPAYGAEFAERMFTPPPIRAGEENGEKAPEDVPKRDDASSGEEA